MTMPELNPDVPSCNNQFFSLLKNYYKSFSIKEEPAADEPLIVACSMGLKCVYLDHYNVQLPFPSST